MLTRLDLRGAGDDLAARLPRPSMGEAAPVEAVREILAEVRKRGDAAVREYTERFDGVRIDDLRVPDEEIRAAVDAIPATLREALEGTTQDFTEGSLTRGIALLAVPTILLNNLQTLSWRICPSHS